MPDSGKTAKDPYEVPALRRAEQILQALAASASPVKAADLLARTGLSRSTLYLLLDSLESKGWIERRQEGYIVGVRLFELGSAYVRHENVREVFRAEAARFVAIHNEVVQMAVLDGAEVVYIAREDAPQPIRLVSDLGMRLPAHCSALGKALLASLDDADVSAALPRTLPALTPKSITRLPDLLAELDTVRRQGIALDREEASAGLSCYAAYIGRTSVGRRLAVSTSVPVSRMTRARERKIVVEVVNMARRIAQRIGGH